MTDEMRKELEVADAEGARLAKRLVRQRLGMLGLFLLVIGVCWYLWGILNTLPVELVLLVVILLFLKRQRAGFMRYAYQDCDPYLQYQLERHYGNTLLGSLKWNRRLNDVCLAQALLLMGAFEEASRQVSELGDLTRLFPAYESLCCNVLFVSAAEQGDFQRRNTVYEAAKRRFDELSRKKGRSLQQNIKMMELSIRMEKGEEAALNEYEAVNPVRFPFQAVGIHTGKALFLLKQGRREEAQPHIDFVLRNGGKLYYKKKLEKALEEM